MRNLYLLLMCIGIFIAGCGQEYDLYDGEGKKPVYISYEELGDIRNLPPQPVEETGAIFKFYDLFFMVEEKKGIHVFDVSDSTSPVNLTFFKIPAVTDFTINGDYLYADNGPNLITIDISDLYNLAVVDTDHDAFSLVLFPPFYRGYFECVDESRGVIVDWVDDFVVDARCRVPE